MYEHFKFNPVSSFSFIGTGLWYQNRNDNGRDYNYDITPLIQNFDFYDFIDYAERFKEEIKDYGAFIVITNKQYIIGYNASFAE